jgi:hypothetical protein
MGICIGLKSHNLFPLKQVDMKVIFFLFLLFTTLSCVSVQNHQTEPISQLSTVTIYLVYLTGGSISPSSHATFRNNEAGAISHNSQIRQNRLIFTDIVPGVYTLEIHNRVICDKIIIRERNTIHHLIIDPDIHEFTVTTIFNHTEDNINTVMFCGDAFIPNWDRHISPTVYHLKEPLLPGESLNIVFLKNRETPLTSSFRLIGSQGTFTNHFIKTRQNSSVNFTEEDLDIGDIRHPRKLEDFRRFPVQIEVRRRHFYVRVLGETKNLLFYINGSRIMLNQQTPSSERVPTWQGIFSFTPFETYKIQLSVNRLGVSINETLYLTIPQDISINFPNYLDDGDIDINWQLNIDDLHTNSFNIFQVERAIHETHTLFRHAIHREKLSPSQRDLRIPAGLIPYPEIGPTTLFFHFQNYSFSGRVSARSIKHINARYYNGFIHFISDATRDW